MHGAVAWVTCPRLLAMAVWGWPRTFPEPAKGALSVSTLLTLRRSSSLMRRNATHGMGLPGIRSPARNRATNSSSVQSAALPVESAVMSGGVTLIGLSPAVSIGTPPARRGPVNAPVIMLRCV